jgi:hypothetical protein
MIIPFKEIPETRKGFPCTAFRWTFQVQKDFIGFIHQAQSDGEWDDSHILVNGLWYHGKWDWGFHHFWYDGPHCGFSLGPLRFQWYNESCKQCNAGWENK